MSQEIEKIDKKLLEFVKSLGVPCRHPQDPFYKEANDICQPLKPFGIFDYGDENLCHKPYKSFACHIPGCLKNFETVIEYEAHYNSCHCFTCKECGKNLPNYHFLDLHISENHDSFFVEMSKRKPMFQCFVQECKEIFNSPQERSSHCIEVHKFPSDFRFDTHKKRKNKKDKKEKKSTNSISVPKENDPDSMEITNDESEIMTDNIMKDKKNKTFQGFQFGQSRGRRKKPVFYNFSKDLMNSLPECSS